MKHIFLLLWLFAVLIPVRAIEAQLSASPRRPVAGEVFTLNLTVDTDRQFSWQVPNLPGLQVAKNFSSNSQQQNIINGKASFRATYGLRALAEKPGKLTIPALTLDFQGEKVKTNSLELIIRDPASLPDGEKFSAVLTISPARKVYAGETLRADLEIFIPAPWQLQGIGNIVPENFADGLFLTGERKFINTSGIRRTASGSAVEMTGVFQVQNDGEFTPVCKVPLQIAKGGGGFFFGPPPETRILTASSKVPLQVMPLPPPPAGAVNTKLVGDWQISAKISKPEIKAGDIAEVTLTFTGQYPAAFFKAPELEFPGTRVYPPEVKRSNSNRVFTVKYPFVAMKPGVLKPEIKLASFDPASGKYRLFTPEISCNILPNDAINSAPAPAAALPKNGSPEQKIKFIPLQLADPGTKVAVPLWQNHGTIIIVALLLTIAGFIIGSLPRKRNEKRQQLRRELQELAGKIRQSSASEVFRREGASILARALSLPPGATFADIAGKLSDPELQDCFLDLENSSFSPGEMSVTETPQLKKKILALLKKLPLILLITFTLPLQGNTDFSAAGNAFDNGDYQKASEAFRELAGQDRHRPDPALIYDQGCARYMLGDHAAAYVLFTRASMLSPQNSLYRRAAELAAAELPDNTASMPLGYLDFLRPDQYWLLASLAALTASILFVLRRRIGGWKKSVPAALTAALLLTAAGIWQSATVYSPDRAVVTGKNALLYSIPARSGGKNIPLDSGTKLFVREEKGDFYRVENADLSGWAAKETVQRIFPFRIW